MNDMDHALVIMALRETLTALLSLSMVAYITFAEPREITRRCKEGANNLYQDIESRSSNSD